MANEVDVKFGADTSQLDAGVAKAEAEVSGFAKMVQSLEKTMNGAKNAIGSAFTGAVGQIKQSESAMELAKGAGERVTDSFKEMAGAMAAAFAVEKIIEWTVAMGEAARETVNLSQQLGIATSDLGGLEEVAKLTGISQGQVTKAIQGMDRSLGNAREGSTQLQDSFKAMGVDIWSSASTMDQFMVIAQKFSTIPDGPEKTRMAMQLLGRSGAELIPIFNKGSDAIKQGMQDAKENGDIASESFLAMGLQTHEAFDNMNDAIERSSRALFEAMGPAILAVVQGLTTFVEDMNAASQAGGPLNAIMTTLGFVFQVLGTVVGAAGVVLGDVFAAATIVAIGVIGTLYAGVMALIKAMSGDFAGASKAWSDGMANVGRATQEQIDKVRELNKHYGEFLKNTWTPPPAPAALPGQHTGTAEGQAVLDAQREAQLQKEKERLAKEAAQRAAALKAKQREQEQAFRQMVAGLDEELKAQQDLYKNDFDKWKEIQEARIFIMEETYGAQSRQAAAARRELEKGEREHQAMLQRIELDGAASRRTIAETNANSALELAKGQMAIERDALAQKLALGKISNDAYLNQLRQMDAREAELTQQNEEKIYQLERETVEAKLNLQDLTVEQRAQIHNQLEQMEAAHQAKMRALVQQSVATQARDVDASTNAVVERMNQTLQPLSQGLATAFGDMTLRGKTWQQSMGSMFQNVGQQLITMAVQMAAKWAATQIAMTAASVAGNATRTASDVTAAATSNAVTAESGLFQIIVFAFKAAAGAFSAMAGIPYVGPFLAVAAGAAALAAVMGFAGKISSAEGGWERVPYDGAMTELHKDEMVLPSHIASPLRAAIGSWAPSETPRNLQQATGMQIANYQTTTTQSGGSEQHLHFSPVLQNYNQSLNKQLRTQSSSMKRWYANQKRNGTL